MASLELASPVVHGGAPDGWLEFSASLNPCGVPAAVRRAVEEARYERYADLSPERAERRLAREAGVPADCVMLTAGASEGLRLAAAMLTRGDLALVSGPTYGEFSRLARLRGGRVDEVRAGPPAFATPTDSLLLRLRDEGPGLLFLCDPNNPTGKQLSRGALRRLLAGLPSGGVLVLDQSFAPFGRPTLTERELLGHARVVLVRSLTKCLGAPGLRAGYLLAAPAVVAAMRAVRDPWAVGAHACAAASAATWSLPAGVRRAVRAWRERLASGLRGLGLRPLPSAANFLLVRVGPRAEAVVSALARRRIAIRWCASFDLPAYVRLAVRPPEEQDRLLAALREVRREAPW